MTTSGSRPGKLSSEVIAAFFGPDAAAAILEAAYPDDSPVPYTLTPEAEWLLGDVGASDFGRWEPAPYDLGITDDPEAVPSDFPDVYTGARPDAEAACQALAEPEPEAEIEAGL